MIDWVNIKSHNHDYIINYSKTRNIKIAALDAAIFTIDHIHKKYPPPYTLFLSGGIDSQAMLYAWLQSGKKFNTFTGLYNFDLNMHDLENITTVSKLWNVNINFVRFNLFKFLHTEYNHYANLYRCASPHICGYMKMSEMVEQGTAIFSGNYVYNNMFVDRNNFGLYKFAKTSNKSMVPFFFMETEELAYSFDQSKEELKLYKSDKEAYPYKVKIYHQNGFPVIPQSVKSTGFEKIKEYYDLNFENPYKNKLQYYLTGKQQSSRVFDILYRNKNECMFGKDKYFIQSRMNQ